MNRICSKCGKEFEVPLQPNGKRYSRTTRCNDCNTDNKSTKKLTCKYCGKEFEVGRGKDNRFLLRDYCSEECCKLKDKERTKEFRKINIKTRTCSKCGKEFVVPILPNCNQYSNSTICDNCTKAIHTEVCAYCGKEFNRKFLESCDQYSNSKFCSTECYENSLKRNKIYPQFRHCEVCGKLFEEEWVENQKRYSESKYCSDLCYRIGYKNKREKTMISRYGVKHHFKLDLFKDKQKQTCLDKYGVPYACKLPQCMEKNPQIVSKLNLDFNVLLKNTIDEKDIELEHNIGDYSFDFKIGDYLIEINPTYTHSTIPSHWEILEHKIKGKDKNYHLNKTNLAIQNGYHCIHVWQWDDWNKIIQLIKPKQKLYARKLQLKEITKQEANSFIDKYHIQGSCYGNNVNIGLFNDNELVQVMTFGKPRYNKNYQWELLRLCSHSNYIVVGGAERLFKYFYNYNPQSIISYCDVSKFSGNIYDKLGFRLKEQTKPAKIWSKGTNMCSKEYITDNLLRQRGYDQLFGTNYGKGTSNEQLMLDNGWLPVYDCGQKVFEWIKQ